MTDALIAKWVVFALGVMTAIMGLAGYGFEHFETREHAQEMRGGIERRLERLEAKIDQLLERK